MLLMLLQAASAVAPISPPRVRTPLLPVVVSAPPAPPVMAMPRITTVRDLQQGERFVVDVTVRAGNEELWAGSLAVSGGVPSTFRREQSDAGPFCATLTPYRSNRQNALSVTLAPARDYDGDSSRLNMTVRWSRPGANECPLPTGNRTVELSETVALAPQQTVTVTGDAMLTVRLHRR